MTVHEISTRLIKVLTKVLTTECNRVIFRIEQKKQFCFIRIFIIKVPDSSHVT